MRRWTAAPFVAPLWVAVSVAAGPAAAAAPGEAPPPPPVGGAAGGRPSPPLEAPRIEVGYSPDSSSPRGKTRYRAGYWHQRDPLEARAPGVRSLYVAIDRALYLEGEGDQGLRGFLQAGTTSGAPNCVSDYLGIGVVYRGLLPGRDEDSLGLGVAHARLPETPGRGAAETDIELLYRVTPWSSDPAARGGTPSSWACASRPGSDRGAPRFARPRPASGACPVTVPVERPLGPGNTIVRVARLESQFDASRALTPPGPRSSSRPP
jgi:hypothetical protein